MHTSFGTNGEVLTSFGQEAQARAAAMQPDGRYVVAGQVGLGNASSFSLARSPPPTLKADAFPGPPTL